MDQDFMLHTETAKTLYHKYAASMPIFDYHNHLLPQEIAQDKPFENLYQIWLSGDHYKWRAMRSFGIEEKFITGEAPPFEKFLAYARMIPHTIGNPLYHWTHLELQRYFGITTLLSQESAREIWDETSRQLKEKKMGPRHFLEASKVKAACTTDDPVDSLEHHQAIAAQEDFPARILPTFRPDKAMALDNREAYLSYLEDLGQAAETPIRDFDHLIQALDKRHQFFHQQGCRLSDHGLSFPLFQKREPSQIEGDFQKLLKGTAPLTQKEKEGLQTAILTAIAGMNQKRGWVMQLHLGPLRNNNTTMFNKIGPDTGFDSINDGPIAVKTSALLDHINQTSGLPKTILYVLNPSDNYTMGTMIGNFQDGITPGKIQFGSGWWFNDQRDGMEAQMRSLANLGLLSQFVGMLTDSRSFLSFPRHEYFRRILCNLIGEWVEKGEYPWDEPFLGQLVQDISFNNAQRYFGIPLPR